MSFKSKLTDQWWEDHQSEWFKPVEAMFINGGEPTIEQILSVAEDTAYQIDQACFKEHIEMKWSECVAEGLSFVVEASDCSNVRDTLEYWVRLIQKVTR